MGRVTRELPQSVGVNGSQHCTDPEKEHFMFSLLCFSFLCMLGEEEEGWPVSARVSFLLIRNSTEGLFVKKDSRFFPPTLLSLFISGSVFPVASQACEIVPDKLRFKSFPWH